ncbi:DNA/RNA helicase domain-containing protein [Bdellovibrio bacteriovorus]|uniref:DNA/RNA helicase domain-containing protein n=1 Tax=Bdellovibrio bacteriovorus TaxID=959 RepID=UPI003AA9649D
MIIYSSDKDGFCSDILQGSIEDKIHTLMQQRGLHRVGASEVRSWENSLKYMHLVMEGSRIPGSAGISIEYHIPNSGKRIDFIISGKDKDEKESVVIIELKQWQEAKKTDKPSIVTTRFLHGEREVPHPSYQAWSYSRLLEDFNETVQENEISILPCAFLHNYPNDGVINDTFYREDIEKAPLFLKNDILKLREFVEKWVRFGDDSNLLYRIDNGKIRPSKSLANHMVSLLKGNKEFTLIDEQKVVYESILSLVGKSKAKSKDVIIVEGGPGTGKTVLAVNLLVEILNRGKLCQYVTKNAAPRAVYEAKLAGHMKKSQISNLFIGSGSFTEASENTFDALLVDEAHRLNEKSGLFNNLGENQIKELITAAKVSVFFIDEDQRVTLKDIGRKDEIKRWAKFHGASVHEMELTSQFRCNGADGYLAWLDHTLGVRETANQNMDGVDYDFQVFDSPRDLFKTIIERNKVSNRARIVAGYCWDWKSKKDSAEYDIEIPEHRFKMKWNLASYASLWILDPNSVTEAGCIHTSQGLELDYIGVIVGPDLLVRNGLVVTVPEGRSKMDQSIKGYKSLSKKNPEQASKLVDGIIRNTYRALMTRGMKGCYIFCTDPETNAYFKECLGASVPQKYTSNRGMLKVADAAKKYRPKKKVSR